MTYTHRFLLATRHSSLATFFLLLFAASAARAQVATGTPPFGSFGGGPEPINLGNNNAHWAIPVLHTPGRGKNCTSDLLTASPARPPWTSASTTPRNPP